MSPFVFHRRTEAYGPDAGIFRPERWLEASDDEKKMLERNLLTFGSGNRVCVGKVRSHPFLRLARCTPRTPR